MSNIPSYQRVLTGGAKTLIPIPDAQRAYIAAVADDDPPSAAYILSTTLEFPARLKAQLRENLKHHGIQVIGQITVSAAELEQIYRQARLDSIATDQIDIDYDRYRDGIISLLFAAVSGGASDIHIVRRKRTAQVSFRIDGLIMSHTEWSDEVADQTCRFIYEVMATDQSVTWNSRECQDAVIDTPLPSGQRVRVRIGTIPASPDGYDMVLRILPGGGETMRLEKLGYEVPQYREIKLMAKRPSGLVVIAGGVGSGKSTSIVAMLQEEYDLHQGRLRIITVEDPPEQMIASATQVPVVRNRGLSCGNEFSFAIRGALRCDPDTLMVGEIRDLQSALLTIKFAQSGHRVYTTVHATTAIGIVGRLTGIGVEPALLCTPDVLKGLIFQTLVPVLCTSCSIPMDIWLRKDNSSAHRIETAERLQLALSSRGYNMTKVSFRGSGCNECAKSGISGRTLIAEIVVPDDPMLSYLGSGDYITAYNHWIENLKGQPASEHGIRLIAAGITSADDVEWRVGPLNCVPPSQSSNIQLLQQSIIQPGHA